MTEKRRSQGDSIPVTLVVAPMFSYLSLAICIDALRVANRLTTALTFDWTIAGESGEEVASSSGPGVVPHTTFAAIAVAPVVILLTAYDPESACTPALMSWLRSQERRGSTIGCVDTGALVLARAGVLRGRQVAAHQEVVAPFREEIGELLLLDRRAALEGNLASSAGGFATMDMVLKLIEKLHSDELARRVARAMNFEMPSSDRVSENPDYPGGATRVDRRLGRMIAVMQANLEAPLPIAKISSLALVEESTARRLFQRHFRQSPRAYYMRLRLERARNLLHYSHLSVGEIAAAAGFADGPSFSHSFSRAFGMPPSKARVNDVGIEYRVPAGVGPSKKNV